MPPSTERGPRRDSGALAGWPGVCVQKAAQLLPQSFWSPDEARPKAKNVRQRPAQANVKHKVELLAVRSLRGGPGGPGTETGPLLRAPSSEIVLFLEKQSSIPLVKKGKSVLLTLAGVQVYFQVLLPPRANYGAYFT